MTTPPGDELDLDKLEALAKKATPGPWQYDLAEMLILPSPSTMRGGTRTGWCGEAAGDNDGEFIAAANPATVLALLARIKAQDAEIERLREEARRT